MYNAVESLLTISIVIVLLIGRVHGVRTYYFLCKFKSYRIICVIGNYVRHIITYLFILYVNVL